MSDLKPKPTYDELLQALVYLTFDVDGDRLRSGKIAMNGDRRFHASDLNTAKRFGATVWMEGADLVLRMES